MENSDTLLPSAEEVFVQNFPSQSGLFTEKELKITESTASDVVAKIASGEWTALEVTKAVCKRTAVAQQLINCVTEYYFAQAYKRAAELDEYYQANGKTSEGSVQPGECRFDHGYVSWAVKPIAEESTLVKLLRQTGAVFYVKTNVPTTLMMGESVNNLFGRTVNPRIRQVTTGGSSGGESALVTFRGSFVGVGIDIRGSIRHPASFTGLYALRPAHGRVSYQQVTNTFLGQEAVRSCAGPMCRSLEDVRLFMSGLLAQRPWLHDPQIVPLPWRQEEDRLLEKLCFGFGMGDGDVRPTPPLRRALEITKAKLVAAGHEVIDFIPHEIKEANEIILKMWTADGGEEIRRDAGATGEPLPMSVEATWGASNAMLKPMTKTAEVTGTGRPIDALIMPSVPFPAVRHDTPYKWNYGVLSPLLDLTTGIFSVTKVDLEKDQIPADWKPISDKDKEIMGMYEKPENHENALIGLALVGRRLEEEKITALLKVINDVVGVDY